MFSNGQHDISTSFKWTDKYDRYAFISFLVFHGHACAMLNKVDSVNRQRCFVSFNTTINKVFKVRDGFSARLFFAFFKQSRLPMLPWTYLRKTILVSYLKDVLTGTGITHIQTMLSLILTPVNAKTKMSHLNLEYHGYISFKIKTTWK